MQLQRETSSNIKFAKTSMLLTGVNWLIILPFAAMELSTCAQSGEFINCMNQPKPLQNFSAFFLMATVSSLSMYAFHEIGKQNRPGSNAIHQVNQVAQQAGQAMTGLRNRFFTAKTEQATPAQSNMEHEIALLGNEWDNTFKNCINGGATVFDKGRSYF